MSSHQNSAFNGESALELMRYQVGPRATRPPVRPSVRIARAPDEIWGQYNNYRSNGLVVSAIVHIAVIGLLLSGAIFGHQIVQKVVAHQTVTLLAPSPES